MIFKTILNVEELNKMTDEKIDDSLSWAYTLLFEQIKEVGSITKDMALDNKELLENNYGLRSDVYNRALSNELYRLPVELLPNKVDEPSFTVGFYYDDCTICFNIDKDGDRYDLFFFEAETEEGYMLDDISEIRDRLGYGDVKNTIEQVRAYFNELRKDSK